MKKIEKNFLKRALLVFVGLLILGTGAGLFLYSGLGADPNSVFMEGFAKKLNISYGTSSLICNAVLAVIIFGIDKSYINFATIATLFIPGYTADFVIYTLGNILNINNTIFFNQVIISLLSGVVLSIGIVIYINQNLGMGAFDAISELISAKKGIKFSTVRRSMDLFMLVLGYLLGGLVGIGTLYLGLTTGSLISYMRKLLDRFSKKRYEYNSHLK